MTGFNEALHPRGAAGKFTEKNHSESDISLSATATLELEPGTPEFEERVKSVVEGIRNGDEKFTLVYTAYDDKLQDKQISSYLAGDLESVDESIDEIFSEYAWDQARDEAREKLKEAGIDPDDLDEDELGEVITEIQDKDDSDILNSLLRTTGDQLMRIKLASPQADGLFSGHTEGVEEAREARIAELLQKQGLDVSSDEAKSAISQLVAEGPWDWHEGVDLDVIFHGDPQDATVFDKETGQIKDRKLSFTKPNILLIDRINGSGHDVQFPGTIAATATKDKPVRLDADKDHGYGWDDVCGLVKSYYKTETATEWIAGTEED